jgi:amino acid transporter
MAWKNLFRTKPINVILKEVEQHPDVIESHGNAEGLKRDLGVKDLTALGIAAVIGAGVFSTIGKACFDGGPAVSLLFIGIAVACGFSALCYAEFASRIPIAGSAYTYSYAVFGELVAWIIGWDLLLEYAIGNIAVAISWSGYLTGLLNGTGVHLPDFLTTDYLTASRGFNEASAILASGNAMDSLSPALQEAWSAWTTAPTLMGIRLIGDIPAFMIVVLITWICYAGIRESKTTNNIMVLLKIGILLLVIGAGAFYVNPENWSPFAPNGIAGVLKGISGVFFAYIGFDAISTTAEECKNPRRDLPVSMFLALMITTILYVAVSLVLTGMVPSSELGVADPLAFVFSRLNLSGLSGIIAVSAVVAMASVLLVFQLGQPRIWMSMSRDGLLPKIFSKIHPKYKTPAFSTIVTGFIVAVPSLFMNLTEVTDLTSIGTLFAFVLVSGGILVVNPHGSRNNEQRGFVVPYLNSRYFLLPIWLALAVLIIKSDSDGTGTFFNPAKFPSLIHFLPFAFFMITSVIISFFAVWRKWSLIPVLGLLTNLYLMSELGLTNWSRFGIWMGIGLLIYFAYGMFHSRLREVQLEQQNR